MNRIHGSQLATKIAIVVSVLAGAHVTFAERQLSFERTAREAKAIVLGTVDQVSTHWGDPSRTWMETDYAFTVEEVVLDDAHVRRGQKVTLTFWGGQIGNKTQFVVGQPLLAKGNRYLLMLDDRYATPGTRNPLVQLNQGWFAVRKDASGRELVFDCRNEPVVAIGPQLFRSKDLVGKKAIPVPVSPEHLLRSLRSDLGRIKSLPARPSKRTSEFNRAMYRHRKQAVLRSPIDTTDIRIRRPKAQAVSTAISPIAPVTRQLIQGGGAIRAASIVTPSKSAKYVTENATALPVVFNCFPKDFAPWTPVDQECMSTWNEYFPDMFRVVAEPFDEIGWLNGVNDLLGFFKPGELTEWGGLAVDDDTGSVIFAAVEDGVTVEVDIAFIAGQDWTLNDEAVYTGELTGVKCFRREMMAALGKAVGLGRQSSFVSLTSNPQEYWDALSLPFRDDVTGLRQLYSSSHDRANLIVNLLSSQGTDDWQSASFPESVVAGGEITVGKFLLENAGTLAATEPQLDWYLCKERNWRSRYVYLGSSKYSELPAGSYFLTDESIESVFTVPDDTRPGEYYLGVHIPDDPLFFSYAFPYQSNSSYSRTKLRVLPN